MIWEEGAWDQSVPDLPVKVHKHCIVISYSFPFVYWILIGGVQDGQPSKKTYFLTQFLEWIEGPELNVARSGAACGTVSDHFVVAGGYNDEGGYLSSTEVWSCFPYSSILYEYFFFLI